MRVVPKHILALVPLLLLGNILLATKALPKLQNFVNPDGTTITIRIMGDHIFGYKQTLGGKMVEIGPDGYLYYVNLTPNGKEVTDIRATSATAHSAGNINPATIQAIRENNIRTLPKNPLPAILHKET